MTESYMIITPEKKKRLGNTPPIAIYYTPKIAYIRSLLLILIPFGIFYLPFHLLDLKHREYKIFQDRIQITEGAIFITTKEYRFTMIKEVTITKSPIGRYFDYGIVAIEMYNEKKLFLKNIEDPEHLLNILKEHVLDSY